MFIVPDYSLKSTWNTLVHTDIQLYKVGLLSIQKSILLFKLI